MNSMKHSFRMGCIALLALLWANMASASITNPGHVEPTPLTIGYYTTTHLIFPYNIKSVDRGSREVLVQKAPGLENILQVKAGMLDFTPTNLTIITADGQLYSFLLSYETMPVQLNLLVGSVSPTNAAAIFTASGDHEAPVIDLAEKIAVRKKQLRRIKDHNYDIFLRLHGVYVQEDLLYFQFEMENNSNLHYDIDQFRMYIRDKKKARRTASQELEQTPLLVLGNTQVIRGQSRQTVVVAIPRFTIPDKKYLSIELLEKKGGRHLGLKVHNDTIVGAAIPD